MIVVFLLFFVPLNAYAYLDLGTAGYLAQIALATLAGAFFALKVFWSRIRYFFHKTFRGKKGSKNIVVKNVIETKKESDEDNMERNKRFL